MGDTSEEIKQELRSAQPQQASNTATSVMAARVKAAKDGVDFIYTKHARERMAERGANDNEVETTVLTGQEVPAKDGKQKFEKTYATSCVYNGKKYGNKKVEVVTAKDEEDWVIVTVIADCK